MTVADFVDRYGIRGLGLVVEEFIGRAPEFRGSDALARLIGGMVADLECALEAEVLGRRLPTVT